MRNDRSGGKRTNWLLIKHRDEFAKEGKANDILDDDRSVASGRAMDAIAEGKGKAPKPFMTAKSSQAKADAVGNSTGGDPAEARAGKNPPSKRLPSRPPPAAKGKKVTAMPAF